MSRAVSLIFTGIGVAGLALGGIYLTGNKYEVISPEVPAALADFVSSNGGRCVKEIFPDIENMNLEDTDDIKDEKISSNFFGDGEIKGCLAIQWSKEKYTNENNKWNGNFRLIWSVKEGNRGFVVFALAESKEKTKNKKKVKVLEWNGIAYELTRESEGYPWKKSRNLVAEGKDQNKDDVKSKFPTVGKFIAVDSEHSFWDFIEVPSDGKNEIENICEMEECKSDNKELIRFNGYWTIEGAKEGKSQQLGDWSSSLDAWWKDIFNEDKWDMKEVIKDKKVKWNRVEGEVRSDRREITIYTGE